MNGRRRGYEGRRTGERTESLRSVEEVMRERTERPIFFVIERPIRCFQTPLYPTSQQNCENSVLWDDLRHIQYSVGRAVSEIMKSIAIHNETINAV